ncbi:serine carboxypeptidase-like 29 [Lotus japonicus]|uniref:serine carboxypeptidase-like 29 n=1 Tax=Lotus japonicus TaxID=34305 RepID=UPI00258FB1C2|nr:serine carboxypeptidase-like 29 [Lotus japonicus]XP_057423140.1 serine carboxypeptidase-like 29 [Lotus japonicus]
MHPSHSCENITEIAHKELGNIDPYIIFTPACHANVSQSSQPVKRKHRFGRLGAGYDPCTAEHSTITIYFNLPEVQRILHVSPNHKPAKWKACRRNILMLWK